MSKPRSPKAASKPRKGKAPKPPKKTRWEWSAHRENARRIAKAPLFVHAGLVPLATPEERQARFEEGALRQEESDRRNTADTVARVAKLRAEIETMVTPAQFEKLYASRHKYPAGPGGELIFFSGLAAELREKPDELTPHQEALARVDGRVARQMVLGEKPDDVLPPPKTTAELRHEAVRTVPCPDCGWLMYDDPLRWCAHPENCPSLRGMLLGMRERCADCKRHLTGACKAHRDRVRACNESGLHVEVVGDVYGCPAMVCTRCGITTGPAPAVEAA